MPSGLTVSESTFWEQSLLLSSMNWQQEQRLFLKNIFTCCSTTQHDCWPTEVASDVKCSEC